MSDRASELRKLPAVDAVVTAFFEGSPKRGVGPIPGPPWKLVVATARRAVDEYRAEIRSGAPAPALDAVVERTRELLAARRRAGVVPVINATGVLVHTNLGRVPLGPSQLDAVTRVASGYSNLEYDLEVGERGSRHSHVAELLCEVTGAEAALVVNNNAAAVLVTLAALAHGREVIISRGELVEIGGEFRIPDVMKAAGVKLVEVGTTNRTHLTDYKRAITENTAAILKVHPSNYRVVGFSKSVPSREVAGLSSEGGVMVINDLGSGLVQAGDGDPFSGEPPVSVAVGEGADVITFSGDKLLGGPQAGLIVGSEEAIGAIEKHPLMRAVRIDKLSLAALQATLEMYLAERSSEIPLWSLGSIDASVLKERAEELAASVTEDTPDAKIEVVASNSVAGGGSLPGEEIASWGLAVAHGEKSVDELERGLRRAEVPVIARIEDDRLILDLRTVFPHQDQALGEALASVLT